jgi:hypothetical protein
MTRLFQLSCKIHRGTWQGVCGIGSSSKPVVAGRLSGTEARLVARPCSCHTAAAMTPPTRKACIHSGLGTKRADGPSAERRTMLACLGRLCVWRGRLRRLRPERRVGRFWGPHGYRWGAAERAAGLRDPARPPAMRLMWRSEKQAPDTFKWPQESGAQCGIGDEIGEWGDGEMCRCSQGRRYLQHRLTR